MSKDNYKWLISGFRLWSEAAVLESPMFLCNTNNQPNSTL
jgi:hypothetical protein